MEVCSPRRKGSFYPSIQEIDMKIPALLCAAVFVWEHAADAQELRPSPANRFTLEVEKTGLLRGKTNVFQFGKYRGTLDYNNQNPELSKVQFEIESKSIVCLDTWLSDKDKVKIIRTALDDMLAADKYPTISFVSNRVAVKTPTRFEVTGTLSIRGVVQSATVSVTKSANTYDGTGVVDMRDYGLKPPTSAFGAVGTKEVMTVKFHLAAGR